MSSGGVISNNPELMVLAFVSDPDAELSPRSTPGRVLGVRIALDPLW